MSVTEILVVLFGLYIGYWLVSRLWREKPERAELADDQAAAAGPAWHDVLEVSPQASVEEIRIAYRRMIGQYHPDKVAALGDELQRVAERKSKEITSAYREAMQLRGANA